MNDEPLPVDLAENIGDAKGRVEAAALLEHAADFRNAMRVRHITTDRYADIADRLVQRPLAQIEKRTIAGLVTIPTVVFSRRRDVERKQRTVVNVRRLDTVDVFAIERRDEGRIKRRDLLPIASGRR